MKVYKSNSRVMHAQGWIQELGERCTPPYQVSGESRPASMCERALRPKPKTGASGLELSG